MNKTSKIIAGVIVVILIIWAIAAGVSKNSQPQAVETIKIGAVLSLSGIASSDGESIKNGLELARTDLKARGIDVDIAYQDDKTEPKDTVSAMNALGALNVEAVIGPTWSYLADSGVPVGDRSKMVMIMPANTSEYVNARSPYAFFTTNKVERLSQPLTEWLKQSGKKRIAIIRNQGAWYEVVEKAVLAAAKEAGVEVVFNENMQFGTAQSVMATILTKMKAKNPDIIFTEIDDEQGITIFFNRSQQLKIDADLMSVTTALGRIVASGSIILNPGNELFLIAPKTSDSFNEKYKATYGTNAKPYADRSYDSLMLLVDAIQNRGDMALNEYLRTRANYKGFIGTYKFDANGDISEGEWVVTKLK